MEHQNKHTEINLRAMISNTSMPFVVSNPRLDDNPIMICNDAFVKLTGYRENEIIGRNCRFLRGKDTEIAQTQQIINALDNHKPVVTQLTNYKRDGSAFQNSLMIAPLFDETGQLAYYLGSQLEVIKSTNQNSITKQTVAVDKIKLLSPQQKRVIFEVSKGYMNKQIAHILQISESTVKMHRAEALAKMNVSTTAEAIRIVVESKL